MNMRILALVLSPPDTLPGQRYRIEQWAPLLRTYGVEIVFEAFKSEELNELLCKPGNSWRKFRLLSRACSRRADLIRSVSEFDAVYVYNEAALLGPPIFEWKIRRSGVPIIYDFDDAIFLPYTYVSPANGYFRLLKFSFKTRAICRSASHIIVGNSYLAEYARPLNNEVTIVPSTIDTAKYVLSPRKPPPAVPVIGWTGSYSTVQYLDALKGTLQRLAKKEPFRLRVIGAPGYQIEGVDVEALPWNSESEVEDLRPIDIGIMPLPDDRWTRGKCGMKALQYLALAIPAVCSRVGTNVNIVKDGECGFLVDTEEDWIEKLTLLLSSPALRERLGQAGRRIVEQEYSASVHAPRVYSVLKSVLRNAEVRDQVLTSQSSALP